MKETGNPLDLMIDGQAMFAVQGDGAIGYTREGGFHVSPDARNPNNLRWSIHKAIQCLT